MLEINNFHKIIVANWKLNGSSEFTKSFLEILSAQKSYDSNLCGVICPPFVHFQHFSQGIQPFYYGGQNCSNFDYGAYTGEISASMLKDFNCQFCIIGHSERRQLFHETSQDIKIKAENLISRGINPIICIGETLEEKKQNLTKDILKKQIIDSLPLNSSFKSVILAYEPIWAIGTGLTPSLNDINEIHSFIKKDLKNYENFKIIYGGSVKSSNAQNIMNLDSVDGVLVGGSSLDPFEFIKILNS